MKLAFRVPAPVAIAGFWGSQAAVVGGRGGWIPAFAGMRGSGGNGAGVWDNVAWMLAGGAAGDDGVEAECQEVPYFGFAAGGGYWGFQHGGGFKMGCSALYARGSIR